MGTRKLPHLFVTAPLTNPGTKLALSSPSVKPQSPEVRHELSGESTRYNSPSGPDRTCSSFLAFLIYYRKSQQIPRRAADAAATECTGRAQHWPARLSTLPGEVHTPLMGPDLRERAAQATQAVLLSGRLPLAGVTSDVPTAGKSSITSNTTTSGSNSAVSAEGRWAHPLLPPHSPALLSGDFRLPAPSTHHVFLLGRYEKTGRSFRGWQITQGTPTPCHMASLQIPEISAPAAQGCTLQPPTLTSPIFWLSSNHLFEHQLKGWAPITLQRQHVRSAAAPPGREVCR